MASAYAVHPEFGYLCPSPRVRRVIRLAFALLVLGLIAGASSVMTTPGSYDAGTTSAEWRADQALAPVPVPAMAAIKASCGENAPASRNGECVSSEPPKVRIVHAATNVPAIARVPLGRSTSPQASVVASEELVGSAPDQQPESAAPSGPTRAASADATAAVATEPSRQSTAAPKPQKRARRQGRQHDQDWRGTWSWREARSERWSGPDRAYASERAYGRHSREGSWGSFW